MIKNILLAVAIGITLAALAAYFDEDARILEARNKAISEAKFNGVIIEGVVYNKKGVKQ